MQLSYLQTLMAGGEGINKVTAMCFSPNDKRLAVCLLDRIVYLYDENGERREKFSTKPGDKVAWIFPYVKSCDGCVSGVPCDEKAVGC